MLYLNSAMFISRNTRFMDKRRKYSNRSMVKIMGDDLSRRNGRSPKPVLKKERKGNAPSIVSSLDDGILLHIFAHLQLMDLVQVGLVCRQWYRVSRDFTLWRRLDLTSLRQIVTNNDCMGEIFKFYPITRLETLDLTGLQVPLVTLSVVAEKCTKLKKLVLKSATIEGNCEREGFKMLPRFLEHLDLRYSNGPAQFYLLLSQHLSSVKWLGICDAFIYALFMDGSLEATFLNMQSLRWLDASHCLLAKDSLVSMVSACKHLEILSVRKCLCVRGTTLGELLSNCQNLKGLILDGTSVSDDVISSLPWERQVIEHLDLDSCWLVDVDCVSKLVTRLSYCRSLTYLGLPSLGDGRTLNDSILDQIARLKHRGLYPSIKTLNVTSSRNITVAGLMSFKQGCGDEVELITDNCLQCNGDGQLVDHNNSIVVNRKCRGDFRQENFCRGYFRSKRYTFMKQFDLESPL